MCTYYDRIITAIHRNRKFWLGGRISLEIAWNGDIKYTKVSRATRHKYSKVIPQQTICKAKILADAKGITGYPKEAVDLVT